MAWDVLYYDPDTGQGYRVRAKRLTLLDGARLDRQIAAANQATVEDDAAFDVAQLAAYLQHGTAAAERAAFDAPPDDLAADDPAWTPYEPDVDAIAALDETFTRAWYIAVLHRNPHRNSIYEALKKSLVTASLTPTVPANSTASAPSASASASGISDG